MVKPAFAASVFEGWGNVSVNDRRCRVIHRGLPAISRREAFLQIIHEAVLGLLRLLAQYLMVKHGSRGRQIIRPRPTPTRNQNIYQSKSSEGFLCEIGVTSAI